MKPIKRIAIRTAILALGMTLMMCVLFIVLALLSNISLKETVFNGLVYKIQIPIFLVLFIGSFVISGILSMAIEYGEQQ